jgi:hypothetical protein
MEKDAGVLSFKQDMIQITRVAPCNHKGPYMERVKSQERHLSYSPSLTDSRILD